MRARIRTVEALNNNHLRVCRAMAMFRLRIRDKTVARRLVPILHPKTELTLLHTVIRTRCLTFLRSTT